MKILIGLILGLLIGAACRAFDIPLPSPPKLIGALLVLAMTVGYLVTDQWLDTGRQVSVTTTAPQEGPSTGSR